MDRTGHTLRMTKQRTVILEELRKVDTHPTADEVFLLVRRRLPKISLGTVYRNLEDLSREGLIRTLSITGTRKRFDGRTDRHYHLRCLGCGRVEDISLGDLSRLDVAAAALTDSEVVGHRLEFIGRCRLCREKEDVGGAGS